MSSLGFYILSKIATVITQPLSLITLLLALFPAIHRRQTRLAWWLFGASVSMLWDLSTDPIADLLTAPLERPYAQRTLPATVDAIVVFGGCLDRRTSVEEMRLSDAADRLVKSVILARRYPDALLVFSGARSATRGDVSEGELLKRLAVQLGIAPERIRVEPSAINTRGNALECRRIVEQESVSSFLLVTSATHMRRSMASFAKVGLTPIPYAVDFRSHPGTWTGFSLLPDPDTLAVSTSALHEYLGLLAYRLRGYV